MRDEIVNATDAHRRLFDALAPVLAHTAAAARGWCDPAAVRLVIQLHPVIVQVVVARAEARPKSVVSFNAKRLPDRGAALCAAVETFAAGVIASLPESGAAAVLANAAVVAHDGGLYVFVDPNDETAILALTKPGRSLGEGTVIGALAAAPETLH